MLTDSILPQAWRSFSYRAQMKTQVYAIISALAAAVMAWPLMRLMMSPIGLFWLLPLLSSVFGLFWFTCIIKRSRLAFVSGILLAFWAFPAALLSWFALISGGPNSIAFPSLVAVIFGILSAIHAGMDDLSSENKIGEADESSNER